MKAKIGDYVRVFLLDNKKADNLGYILSIHLSPRNVPIYLVVHAFGISEHSAVTKAKRIKKLDIGKLNNPTPLDIARNNLPVSYTKDICCGNFTVQNEWVYIGPKFWVYKNSFWRFFDKFMLQNFNFW